MHDAQSATGCKLNGRRCNPIPGATGVIVKPFQPIQTKRTGAAFKSPQSLVHRQALIGLTGVADHLIGIPEYKLGHRWITRSPVFADESLSRRHRYIVTFPAVEYFLQRHDVSVRLVEECLHFTNHRRPGEPVAVIAVRRVCLIGAIARVVKDSLNGSA